MYVSIYVAKSSEHLNFLSLQCCVIGDMRSHLPIPQPNSTDTTRRRRPKRRRRRRQIMHINTPCRALGPIIHSVPPLRPRRHLTLQPRPQIIIPTTSENPQPKHQLNPIDNDAQDIQLWLKEDRNQRSQIPQRIDEAKGK